MNSAEPIESAVSASARTGADLISCVGETGRTFAGRMKEPLACCLSGFAAGTMRASCGRHGTRDEEVDRIVEITRELLGRKHTDREGKVVGPLRIEDILCVAPYNMQVRRLRERSPEGARTEKRFRESPCAALIWRKE